MRKPKGRDADGVLSMRPMSCSWRLGFRRASVDSIAERAGVTKRTVYAYFLSKDDLLAAVLQRYAELATERLRRIGDRMPADRIVFIDPVLHQLGGWASATPRWSGSGFTRLVVEPGGPAWPSRPRHRAARQGGHRGMAAGAARTRAGTKPAGACWREIMLLTEGSMVLTLIHGGRGYIDAAARAARQLVRQTVAAWARSPDAAQRVALAERCAAEPGFPGR